jgi:hypothetical protein
MKIGCRTIVVVQEVCTRSISFGEVDSMASIFQIRDTVSLYNSLLTLEVVVLKFSDISLKKREEILNKWSKENSWVPLRVVFVVIKLIFFYTLFTRVMLLIRRNAHKLLVSLPVRYKNVGKLVAINYVTHFMLLNEFLVENLSKEMFEKVY